MAKPNDFKGKDDDLKPRERLMRAASVDEVSDESLLAILLKTGAQGCDVIELSRRLISVFGSLKNLVNSDWRQIRERISAHNAGAPSCPIKGIGLVKCLELAAAFELGRRGGRLTHQDLSKIQIRTSEDAYRVFRNALPTAGETESVYVLPLDSRNRPICLPIRISDGSVGSSAIVPSVVFREAVRWSARSIVVAHNHPSGDPTPSAVDINATRTLREAAQTLGVRLLDHLVLGSPDSEDGAGFVSIMATL